MTADKARGELAELIQAEILSAYPRLANYPALPIIAADAALAAGYVKVTEDAETLERVTQAIYGEDEKVAYWDGNKPHLENDYDRYESMAKAAIAALRGGVS